MNGLQKYILSLHREIYFSPSSYVPLKKDFSKFASTFPACHWQRNHVKHKGAFHANTDWRRWRCGLPGGCRRSVRGNNKLLWHPHWIPVQGCCMGWSQGMSTWQPSYLPLSLVSGSSHRCKRSASLRGLCYLDPSPAKFCAVLCSILRSWMFWSNGKWRSTVSNEQEGRILMNQVHAALLHHSAPWLRRCPFWLIFQDLSKANWAFVTFGGAVS